VGRDRKKRPKVAHEPDPHKLPRVGPSIVSDQRASPSWLMGKLDTDGPWCWTKMTAADALAVAVRLRHLESMKWLEIEGPKHHAVGVGDLCGDAQRRLEEIHLDDTDSIFSFRLDARKRIWGIRLGAQVYLLWWDPEHEVCPSGASELACRDSTPPDSYMVCRRQRD
jgi:hypothetical protein